MNTIWNKICIVIGLIGSAITSAFGGWDAGMTTLGIMMIVDYVSGFIVAAVFKKSPKTESGALESRAGWKGLIRKGAELAMVLVAYRLDVLIGTTFIKDACVIGFIVNEALSIVENMGLMGVPIPPVIEKAIAILKAKSEEDIPKGDED